MNILFSKEQNSLYLELRDAYKEENKLWNIFNVIIPVIIIFIPTILFAFLPPEKANLQNLVLNGSFSLLGINILFSMCTYLIFSLRLKDEKMENQITQLRKRLIIYLCALLILGTLFYVLQIGFLIQSVGQYITVLLGSSLLLFLSINIGKRIFLLKDELVGKPFNEDVDDHVKDLKGSVDDLE